MNTEFNIDEINRAWSELLSGFVIAKLSLEKQVAALRSQIQEMTANEAALVERIQELEAGMAKLEGK